MVLVLCVFFLQVALLQLIEHLLNLVSTQCWYMVSLTCFLHHVLLPALQRWVAGDLTTANDKQLEARLQFLLAVIIAQHKQGLAPSSSASSKAGGNKAELYRARYQTTSPYSLANDLGVPHDELRKRQVALKYLKQ